MNGQSAVIIGGGIGGLFTGAFLSKEGFRVTVLEKNAIIGGGLQCFKRGNKIYETGMHVLGGFEPGQSLYKICSFLGIIDRLNIHHIPEECMDQVTYGSGDVYEIPSGRKNFEKYFASLFPEEKEGITSYLDEIYSITEEVPLFYLNESGDGMMMHSDNFIEAADHLIARHVKNPKLREILAYFNPLYGGVAGHTPAYVHALINVLYINGASRFAGGSQQLAEALKDVIEEGGGEVFPAHEVKAFEVENREIKSVITGNGKRFSGDWYISAVHPVEMLKMMPEGTFLKGYTKRLNEIPNSNSAFTLFIDLKEHTLPYIDHTCYFMEDYGAIWTQSDYNGEDWPLGFMYMTPPDEETSEFASRLLVHCIMNYDQVREWEDSKVGHRPKEYNEWKDTMVSKILSKLERIFPGFKDMVNNVYAASPLTIRDYYHTKEGAIFGYRKDCENMMLSQLPIFTKVKNLLLSGQNINLHGICGVPLTAISTAEAILGNNKVVRDINNVYEIYKETAEKE